MQKIPEKNSEMTDRQTDRQTGPKRKINKNSDENVRWSPTI